MYYIAIDFDGTVVTHRYPMIGDDIGAVPVLKELTDKGHKLILNTMRSDQYLEAAENWFKEHNIPLFGSNINPAQKAWTNSTKAYAHLYIDDAALGCPTEIDKIGRKYVNWEKVRTLLENEGIL